MGKPSHKDLIRRRLAVSWLCIAPLLLGGAGRAQEAPPPEIVVEDDPAPAVKKKPANPENRFTARWMRLRRAVHDLTHYDLAGGKYRFYLGLRFQIDGTAGSTSDLLAQQVGGLDGSVDLRRVRLFADGTLFYKWRFRFTYDFGVDDGLKDAWVDGLEGPLHQVTARFGFFLEPFSLSRYTGNRNLPFLERALPVFTMAPGRNIGAMLHHTALAERLYWAFGLFTIGDTTEDNQAESDFSVVGRVTGLPVYRNGGERLVHVGLSYRLGRPRNGVIRYAARPEARFVQVFADTGDIAADDNSLMALEIAGVTGGWWGQAEYLESRVSSVDAGTQVFEGGYVQFGRILNGRSRPYNRQIGAFTDLRPRTPYRKGNPFRPRQGGIMEVVGRVSMVDLDSGPIRGGRVRDYTAGLNWYPSASNRLMLNYIHSEVETGGSANIVLLRYGFNPP